MRRKKSFRLPKISKHKKPVEAIAVSVPSEAPTSSPLNGKAPEFIPGGTTKNLLANDIPPGIGVSTTNSVVLNDRTELPGSTTRVESFTRGSTTGGTSDETGAMVSLSVAAQAAVTRPNITKASRGDTSKDVSKPKADPKSVYIHPHRRRKSSETGIFLKPIVPESTIPFPTGHGEPQPEIKRETAEDEETLKVTEESKYWVCLRFRFEILLMPLV